jgi:hypothetical protein
MAKAKTQYSHSNLISARVLGARPCQNSRLRRRNRTTISKLAMAELAKQMPHMPGVVHSSPPFPTDTFQMAKTDDDFHFEYLHSFYLAGFTLLGCAALRLVKRLLFHR